MWLSTDGYNFKVVMVAKNIKKALQWYKGFAHCILLFEYISSIHECNSYVIFSSRSSQNIKSSKIDQYLSWSDIKVMVS